MAPVLTSAVLALIVATSPAAAGASAPAPQSGSMALGVASVQSPLERPARLAVRDVPLASALTSLAKTAAIELAFSPSMLPKRTVSCSCTHVSVARALDHLLEGTGATYRARDEQILISRTTGVARQASKTMRVSAAPTPGARSGDLGQAARPRFMWSLLGRRIRLQGSVTGVVTNRETGEPLDGAQVSIEGANRGALTNQAGRFVTADVPVGTYAVSAVFLGFNTARQENVVVRSGETTEVQLALETTALQLQQITVTATADPIEGVRSPFTVSRIDAEQLPIPSSGTVLAALSGKVAGAKLIRSTGQPGSGVNIMLRSPTGHQTGNSPLLVIDGVVIGRSMGSTTMDFESLDIESVEVIKGAAAASLYGSRASAGVIAITTKRGEDTPLGETRITSRTEYGGSFLGRRRIPQAQHHHFLMNDEGTAPVNEAGEEVDWASRVPGSTRFADQPFPGPTFDNMDALYRAGPTFRQSLSLSQRTEGTTYLISGTTFRERGALEGDDGIQRNDARFTLDHQLGDRLRVALTGRHMRTHRSNLSGSPNTSLLRFPANIDLGARDSDGNFIRRPSTDVTSDNPLWRQYTRDNYQDRTRTTGSARVRLHAFNWLDFDAQLSYDRYDANYQIYVPKGTPSGATSTSDGQIEREHLYENAYDGSLGATLTRQFGGLDARLSLRGTFERAERQSFGAQGLDLIANGVRSLDAAREIEIFDGGTGSIGLRDERANGGFANLALNFRNKLTGEFRVRRDGSSLFGEQERWHTYFGAAAAYRISQEPWFDLPHINEFKVRYAMGEAGGRPSYAWQWERWQVDRIDGLTRFATSGNSQLRPHFTREQEVGLDLIAFNNRLSLELVYAWHMSRDQMITVPATVIDGYSSARANAGVLEGRTYEATLEVFPVRTRNTTWSVNMVMDNSKNYLAEWDRSCFWGSNASGREHEFSCGGERMGNWWMQAHAQNVSHLPVWLEDRADEFQVNDDGYLVWVGLDEASGQPNSFRDGAAKGLLGQSFSAGGFTYHWGEPFLRKDDEGLPVRVLRGNSEPDLNFGVGTRVRYKGFSVFGQFRGQIGGRIYNRTKHFMYALGVHGDIDQSSRDEPFRKPVDYYQRGLADENDCTGSDCSGYIEHFLENGTYVKLGELSVAYSFDRGALQQILGQSAPRTLTLRLNAQNLFTLVNGFTGYDPERGSSLSRIDTPGYPHMRSLTGTVEITF